MTTTTQARKPLQADDTPFELPRLTSGYPLDDSERAAIDALLDETKRAKEADLKARAVPDSGE